MDRKGLLYLRGALVYVESPIKVDNFFPIFKKKIPRKCNKIQEHFLNVGKLQISFLTTAIRAAALASGTPVAFETNGTVREARGLASSTYKIFSAIAN